MPKIRRVTIRNFRSIVELTMDATDLTVIVGDNDCGKSNVLRALNLFFNDQTNPETPFSFPDDYNRFAEPKAKRAPEISVEVDLELPYNYRKNNGDLIRWRKRWRSDGLQEEDEYWGIRRARKKRGKGYTETVVEIDGRSRVPALLSRIQFEYVPAVRSSDFLESCAAGFSKSSPMRRRNGCGRAVGSSRRSSRRPSRRCCPISTRS